jgi:hypothetical protein
MLNPEKAEIVKGLIDEERLKTFQDIFIYITKTEVARELGINYTRFLGLTKNPKNLRYSETYAIAKLLKVDAKSISRLVHNQLDARKPGSTKK